MQRGLSKIGNLKGCRTLEPVLSYLTEGSNNSCKPDQFLGSV